MRLLFDDRVGAVRVAISSRAGGCSAPPYDGLNVGLEVGDDGGRVLTNRALVAGALGLAPAMLVFLRQVHGTRVLTPEEVAAIAAAPTAPGADHVPQADAAVLSAVGVAVAVTAADCLPLLLADRAGPLAGVAHIGRRGLAAGLGPATLQQFAEAGARDPVAVLGPAIGSCCYEVEASLAEEVDACAPGAAATTRAGTPALDLRRALRRQLRTAGLSASAVSDVPRCTAEDADLFSYRRDGVTGRFCGVVAISGDGRR